MRAECKKGILYICFNDSKPADVHRAESVVEELKNIDYWCGEDCRQGNESYFALAAPKHSTIEDMRDAYRFYSKIIKNNKSD